MQVIGCRMQESGGRRQGPGIRVRGSRFRLEKMNFEHRTPNVERRMAKALTDGPGPIGSSKSEVERWTFKGITKKDAGYKIGGAQGLK